MRPGSERQGRLEMLAAMALSGTIGFFVVESGQSVWNVVFFRCLFGALSLFAYCWAKGLLLPWRFTTRTLGLAVLSGVAIVLNWVLLFSSYEHASISIATAVYNTQPFFLILMGMISILWVVFGYSVAFGEGNALVGNPFQYFMLRGVGAALLTAVIEYAREQVEIMQLTVAAINEPARRLYTRMGFVEYGRQERALKHGHRYFDEVLMMKSLR